MLSGAQSPAHPRVPPRGAALSHQLFTHTQLPEVCVEGASGQGSLTEVQMLEVASEGPSRGRPGWGGGAGGERGAGRTDATPFPAVWPPALPARHPPTALAGKELTSRLLSKNVELLIPTA